MKTLGETVQDPGEVPTKVGEPTSPLQDVLRSLMSGRGIRDRLLLNRWAKALDGNLVDTSVVFKVDEDGKIHVGVSTEEGIVLEDDSNVTPQGEQA